MREKLIEIMKLHKKNFSLYVKNDPALQQWIEENTLVHGDVTLSEKIYSIIYQENGICKNGNKRSYENFTNGFRAGCGHSSKCQCCMENTIKKVKEAKANYTEERKQEINETRKNTMTSMYGHAYNSQRPEIKEKLQKSTLSQEIIDKLKNKDWLNEEYNIKQRSLLDLGNELGVYYGTIGDYCRKHGFSIRQRGSYSMAELEVKTFIETLGFQVDHSNWNILDNKEIDLYIPEKKFGIEIDGLFWHSYNPYRGPDTENRNKHLEKTVDALKSNVELIHITDYEWRFKKELVKSLLTTKLGKAEKIFARKCDIKEVDTTTEKQFLISNHFQGYIPSSYAIGLYLKDELVSIMTVGNSRFDKSAKYELLRFCTKLNTVVIGGAEKLFNNVLNFVGNESILSYCDISKFNGYIYTKLGFEKTNSVSPGYFWTDGDEIIISRFKCQKKQLQQWLPSFDENKSESENMFDAGFRRFWDCGQQKYIKNGNIQPINNVEELDINLPEEVDSEIKLPKIVSTKEKVDEKVETIIEVTEVPIVEIVEKIIPVVESPVTNQRGRILELVETKPKHFSRMIQNDAQLLKWVEENSLIKSIPVEMIYSAIYQVSNVCPIGNIKKLRSFKEGFTGCGVAGKCKCAAELVSKSSKESHSQKTVKEKAIAVQKRRETNLKEYGHINAAQTESVKQKHKDHYDSLRSKTEIVIPNNSTSDADRGYEKFKNTVKTKYNFTLLTPRDEYYGIRQKDALEYKFQCNSCGAIQFKKFNHGRGIVCHVCNGGKQVEKQKTPQEIIKQIIDINPTNFSRIIQNDSNLVKWITENTLVQTTNFAESCYSALYQVGNVCENGKIKKFTSIKDGYRGCGRAGVCQCANDLLKQSLKNANTLVQEKRDIISNNNVDTIISDDLKNRLLTLFNGKNAKAYPTIIRFDINLYKEIVNATNRFLPESDSERCYIILNGEPPKCKYGNKRKYNTFIIGYRTGCVDPTCTCSKESQREKVSAWQASVTVEQRKTMHEKAKETYYNKYGVDNPFDSPDFVEGLYKKHITQYGVKSNIERLDVKEKIKQTIQEKYGVDMPFQSKEIQNKGKQTTIDRYGGLMIQAREGSYRKYNGKNPFEDEEVKKRCRETMVEKYGTAHAKMLHLSIETIDILESPTLFKQTVLNLTPPEAAVKLGVTSGTIWSRARLHDCVDVLAKSTRSKWELLLKQTFIEHGLIENVDFIHGDRTILNGKELDFYFPKFNFAVEVGSLYWHSELNADRTQNYHYNKWENCKINNITLVQLWDDELSVKMNSIISHILQKCNKSIENNTTYQINEISSEIANKFLTEYDISYLYTDPGLSYAINYGAFINEKLVSVLTLNQINDFHTEIVHFTTDKQFHYNVLKLMLDAYVTNTNFHGKLSVITDNRHGEENYFELANFSPTEIIPPDYSYVTNYAKRYSHDGLLMEDISTTFGINVTNKDEWAVMQELGFDRVWDAGKIKWELDV